MGGLDMSHAHTPTMIPHSSPRVQVGGEGGQCIKEGDRWMREVDDGVEKCPLHPTPSSISSTTHSFTSESATRPLAPSPISLPTYNTAQYSDIMYKRSVDKHGVVRSSNTYMYTVKMMITNTHLGGERVYQRRFFSIFQSRVSLESYGFFFIYIFFCLFTKKMSGVGFLCC